MNKKNLIIVGKKSFIGSNIYKLLKDKTKISIFNIKEFLRLKNNFINNYNYVCNCSVNKKNVFEKYKSKFDYDLKIADKIKNLNTNYIFLSSRKVYKPKFNIKESQKLEPVDIYARNKIITETKLKKKLKSKLLILRISNVIGIKKFKNPRQVHKTFFDNYLEISKKDKLNKKFYNEYKDFISINQLSKIFLLILRKKINGIYNISLGKKISIKEIVNWLDKYNYKKVDFFYKKTNKSYLNKNSFFLNNSKITKKIGYKPKKIELKKFCLKLSKIIHRSF